MQIRKHISLKWRTMFVVAGVMTLILGVTAVWTNIQNTKRETGELMQRGELLVAMQAKALSQPMWDLNNESVQGLISSLSKDIDFIHAYVKDKQGNLVAEHGPEGAEPDQLVFKSPITYNDGDQVHDLGQLELILSQGNLKAGINNLIFEEIQNSLLLLLITIGTIWAVIRYLIIKPLSEITTAMGKMSQGQLDHVIPFTRFDEFGVMITAFNTMTKTLAKNYRTIEERTNDLMDANEQLETAREEAELANRTKSQFLANMSHELRTPLNAIIGYSEILIEEAPELSGDEFVPDLDRIVSSARHLLQLINEVLDLSKIEAGKMTLHLEEVSLKNMIKDVRGIVNPLMQKGINRFEVNVQKGLDKFIADEMKVRQSLLNLLSNAAKFTHNGKISLDITKQVANDNDWVLLTVKDSGIGMTQEQLRKIFDAFTQADESTTRKYGGTGLGLAITKKVCVLMGGDVLATSKVGEGSSFALKLPLDSKKISVQG